MIEKRRLAIHVISGLGDGGAEGVLFRLCTSDRKFKHIVVTMTSGGKYYTKLVNSGISVYCLGMKPGFPSLRSLRFLYRILKENKPFVVQTWMYHADFLGGLVARMAGCQNVIWNIRNSDPDCMKHSILGRYLPKMCAALSRCLPRRIVLCASKAADNHRAIGYDGRRFDIIHNGYDLSRYMSRPVFETEIVELLPTRSGRVSIGMVARFNPQKDHYNLFDAISILDHLGLPLNFVLIGPGMEAHGEGERILMDGRHLKNCRVYFLGAREDVPDFMNIFDIHVLSSRTEGFPNVLAEAMACGTPCVATNTGDAQAIIGDTGWIVPPGSPKALADAIRAAIDSLYSDREEWKEREARCRRRVETYFSLESMIDSYVRVWCGDKLE